MCALWTELAKVNGGQNIPVILQFLLYILTTAAAIFLMQIPASAAEKVLASFATKDAVKAWNSVNDGVMGGVSKGGASRTEQGTLLFSGELSLANNGGFASIRTEPRSLGLAGSSAIVVKARGDGRTYSIELRVAGQTGASSYRADLPTSAGQWQETRISLEDFKPQAFGRALPFKPVNPANVDSIGFTLADKKAGPFNLEIEWVHAIDDPPTAANSPAATTPRGNTLVDVATAAGSFKTLLAAATAAELVGVLAGEPLGELGEARDVDEREGTLDLVHQLVGRAPQPVDHQPWDVRAQHQ